MSREAWRDELGRLVNPKMVTFAHPGLALALRVYVADGCPWFIAADVKALLGTTSDRGSKARLLSSERSSVVLDTSGGKQVMLTVSEAGLHVMLAHSRRPVALDVLRWVLADVLPTLRRPGQD